MSNSQKTKKSLFASLMALVMCFSMFAGTTMAWFTDTATAGIQNIVAGVLDVEIVDKDGKTLTDPLEFVKAAGYENEDVLWEPGVSYELEDFYIQNKGNLALKYKLYINGAVGDAELLEALEFTVKIDGSEQDLNTYEGALTAKEKSGLVKVYVHMKEDAGNKYQTLKLDGLAITVYAAQDSVEFDSYGNTYDQNAKYSIINSPVAITYDIPAEKVDSATNTLKEEIVINAANGVKATIPAGTKLADGATQLKFTVDYLPTSGAGVDISDAQTQTSVDVHIEGVAADNAQPIEICLGNMLSTGLNKGNYDVYHVEGGSTNAMTENDDLNVHNQFEYDPATGFVTIAIATFSEVAAVADTESAWEGKFDYDWYTDAIEADADETEFIIANADQLAGFGAIVGGMDGQTQNSFAGKTVKLVADINLGDKESENNPDIIFYPIGYYNSNKIYEKVSGGSVTSSVNSFEGTFDGNGHTISNFYQNTWEMFGDYNEGYPAGSNHYKDAMGLFGYVLNGTVKNLTVNNFKSDGEFTPTGVIAAFADGNSTFENIAIVDCNPRVYNTGNGGIIGIAGDTSTANDDHITLKNITVDNSNKISALWGSWDVACGGLVGMYRGNVDGSGKATGDTISFENCHVSAIIDVYNDVCANYQYYAYRYAGMMIGSVRHNTTKVVDGVTKTVPDMTGISASGCTVNYGDWNDYYYCEFEKNTMASYSEDYQFSRVPHSELNFTDSNGNGLVDANERASVTGCTHTHTANEDKQAVYLPFHQLFTGYSWGVSSIGLEKYSGIVTNLDITEGDQEESVVKFEKADTAEDSYTTETTVTIGNLFTAIENTGVAIDADNVQVTVSPVEENGTAGATYTPNTTDWTQGTLTFNGTGAATITITDYYFCTPTTITVNVLGSEQFTTVFENTDEYLYRVGNQNAVKLGNLFKATDNAEIGDVSVKIENVAGADGTYTPNATWTNGTIQFSGTGVVKVTISDEDSLEYTLTLEVVDAENITSAKGTIDGGNFVLLCDVNTSTYVNYWNSNLYGNGFTYSLNGAPTAYNSKQGHGILITKNATLDNLVIVGDVYNSYGAYTNQDYYNAAVDVLGDTTIQNCYISDCASPVNARSNVTIKNTILYGGAVANLMIKSGTVTLENVTTANYADGRALVGMGIVAHSDVSESAKLVINGTLKQYNFINENNIPSDSNAKILYNAMFDDACSQYHFDTDEGKYVNTGIISMSALFNASDITDNANTGYVGSKVSVNSVNGYVYTQPNTSGSVDNSYTEDYSSTTQGAVLPTISFDHTINEVAKTDGSNDYCYEESGTVYISMDEGDSFDWDTSILTATKLGQALDYTVTMNGTDYTGKTITFDTAGDYTVTYTYTDGNNFKLDENGNITTYEVTYTKTVNINVSIIKQTTKHAEFTFGSDNKAVEQITVDNKTYLSATNKTADGTSLGCMTVGTSKIYYPIVEAEIVQTKASSMFNANAEVQAYFYVFDDTITITDYENGGSGNPVTYDSSTTTAPTGLTVVKGNYGAVSNNTTWYSSYNDTSLSLAGAQNVFKYAGSNEVSSTPTTRDSKLCYASDSGLSTKNRSEYYTLVQYQYTDNAGAIYYYYVGYHMQDSKNVAPDYSGGCVTPDTLVTMADGTQKEIQHVTYEDQILVWDFYTGSYTIAPPSIVMNHGYDNYEIVTVNFEDGTSVNTINGHGFYDADTNEFVILTASNVADYIGHNFVKQDGNGYTTVKLVDYSIKTEYTESWSVLTSAHYNCVLENMWTLTPAEVENSPAYLMPFEVGKDMKYIEDSFKADIEKYGLYEYADFAEYMTEAQFKALNLPIFKVAVGKGYITYEDILYLIGIHIG